MYKRNCSPNVFHFLDKSERWGRKWRKKKEGTWGWLRRQCSALLKRTGTPLGFTCQLRWSLFCWLFSDFSFPASFSLSVFLVQPALTKLTHLDQGYLIILNGLQVVPAHPKIHPFLSLVADSWQEAAWLHPTRNCEITKRENGENRWAGEDQVTQCFSTYTNTEKATQLKAQHSCLVVRKITNMLSFSPDDNIPFPVYWNWNKRRKIKNIRKKNTHAKPLLHFPDFTSLSPW